MIKNEFNDYLNSVPTPTAIPKWFAASRRSSDSVEPCNNCCAISMISVPWTLREFSSNFSTEANGRSPNVSCLALMSSWNSGKFFSVTILRCWSALTTGCLRCSNHDKTTRKIIYRGTGPFVCPANVFNVSFQNWSWYMPVTPEFRKIFCLIIDTSAFKAKT